MKQEIYLGNITKHLAGQSLTVARPITLVDSSTITFTGFDISTLSDLTKKLDLLFYNRVNEIGEVLSSLVYISNVLDTDDITEKVYDVRKLYINTNTEILMGILKTRTDFTYLNCKWESSNYFTSSISPMAGTDHEELATNGNPSVKLEMDGIAFDGWYTQMSVGVKATPSPWAKDVVGYHTFAGIGSTLSVALIDTPTTDAHWTPYYTPVSNGTVNPDGSVAVAGTSLANLLITTSANNPYVKQDIFVIPTYLELYNLAVVKYAEEPTYSNPFPQLRNKHRIIHNFAVNNDFVQAQYLLQSTDLMRMTTQL